MGVKRKIITATSEPYPDGTIRPPEELAAAVKRRRHVPLTLGHPPTINGTPGPIPEHLLLGDVEYQYNDEGKVQIGNLTFFDEYLSRLPEHVRAKVVNLEPIPVSQGYEHGWRDERTLVDIVPHHLAVLLDEKPLCPLNICGVNVRQESGLSYRYEQRAEATEETLTMAEEPTPDPIEGLRKEFADLKLFIEDALKPKEQTEAPVAVEREEQKEAEPPPPPEQAPVRAPDPVPVRSVPASAPIANDGLERDPVTGGILIPLVKPDRSKKQ